MKQDEADDFRLCSRCGKLIKAGEVCHCIEEGLMNKITYESMYIRKQDNKESK